MKLETSVIRIAIAGGDFYEIHTLKKKLTVKDILLYLKARIWIAGVSFEPKKIKVLRVNLDMGNLKTEVKDGDTLYIVPFIKGNK